MPARRSIEGMARVRAVAVASAVLLAAGCGGSSGAPRPSVTTLDESAAKARLLTLNDMPAGFTAATDSADAPGPVRSPDAGGKPIAGPPQHAGPRPRTGAARPPPLARV